MRTIILSIVFAIGMNYANAQIKVNPNNTVRIGDISYTNGQTVSLQITDRTYFNCLPASSGVNIQSYSIYSTNVPMLRPQWGNTFYVGNSDRYLWRTYSRNIHYFNLYKQSDQRFKTNINTLTKGINEIMLLNPVTYDTQMGIDSTTPEPRRIELIQAMNGEMGFLAQEVQQVLPKIVNYDSDEDMYMVDFTALIPVLVKALQEQQNKILEMEAEINALQGQD
tara:strand:+ start:1047 stop:1715 length:669 start_codon:yes stop_codon:yes gene_type:complete